MSKLTKNQKIAEAKVDFGKQYRTPPLTSLYASVSTPVRQTRWYVAL